MSYIRVVRIGGLSTGIPKKGPFTIFAPHGDNFLYLGEITPWIDLWQFHSAAKIRLSVDVMPTYLSRILILVQQRWDDYCRDCAEREESDWDVVYKNQAV